MRFYVSMLVQSTGKVLRCPSSFFLYINSSSQICLGRQTICKIFFPTHFRKKVRSTILSIWICSDSISCALKRVSRASFNAKSSSSFLNILLYCWVHVPPVFTPSQTAPPIVSSLVLQVINMSSKSLCVSPSFLKGPWESLWVFWKHMGLVQGQSTDIETGTGFLPT